MCFIVLFFAPESSGPLPEEARKPDQTPPVVINHSWRKVTSRQRRTFGVCVTKSRTVVTSRRAARHRASPSSSSPSCLAAELSSQRRPRASAVCSISTSSSTVRPISTCRACFPSGVWPHEKTPGPASGSASHRTVACAARSGELLLSRVPEHTSHSAASCFSRHLASSSPRKLMNLCSVGPVCIRICSKGRTPSPP